MPDDGASRPSRSPCGEANPPSWRSEVRDGLLFLATWWAIGAAILLMGALSARGIFLLRQIDLKPQARAVAVLFPDGYFPAVLYFSVCGGLTIGLLFLSWRIARPGGFGWGMGVIVLSLILVAIFIWPTPYKYYKTNNRQLLLRVTRATGHGEIIPRGYAPQAVPGAPGEQTTESPMPRPPQARPEKP